MVIELPEGRIVLDKYGHLVLQRFRGLPMNLRARFLSFLAKLLRGVEAQVYDSVVWSARKEFEQLAQNESY